VEHLRASLESRRGGCAGGRSTAIYFNVTQAVRGDEELLRAEIVRLASRYGRYGYRRITHFCETMLGVNHKRGERIWRQEGLKVPKRQPSGGGCG